MSSFQTVCRIISDSLEQEDKNKISKKGASIQEVFFEIQKQCPALFPDLIFDESGITPYSEELEQILYQLEIGEILSTGNPDFKEYQVKNQNYLKSRGDQIKNNKNLKQAVCLFKNIMVK